MKVGIMQPYFFPYIGYFQLINAVDEFVIYDDVNFIKKGYINRNSILINDEAKKITLSLNKASQNKLINEITIGDSNLKVLRSIRAAYGKTLQFNTVYPLIENILVNEEKNLARFLGYSLFKISEYLNINTKFKYSSEIQKDNTLKSQEKIIDICQILNADQYINPIGGQELYTKDLFSKKKIILQFIKTKFIEYQQHKQHFVSNLSIIDVLMFNNKADIHQMLNNYSVV